jgi:hypothetical protein
MELGGTMSRGFVSWSKEEDWSHILRCEGTKIWRDQSLDKRFRNIDAEIGIGTTEECGSTYKFRYEEKWERMVRGNESEVEINLDE